jgi:hypothetical protein
MPRSKSISRDYPLECTRADPFAIVDPALDDLSRTEVRRLLGPHLVHVALPPPHRSVYPGETPVEGAGAVARWVALYDRARDLQRDLAPGDGVRARQAQRALRSLILYEHQLTPTTRRQARTVLWQRERAGELPGFAVRVRWTRCHCAQCQPRVASALPLPPAATAPVACALLRGA